MNEEKEELAEKTLISQMKNYTKGRLLGKGGFAKCYQFTHTMTNNKYAAKIIQKNTLNKHRMKQKLVSQIKIHQSLSHQHIVHFEKFFEDAEFVYILLELCPNQTLHELLKRRKRLTEIQVQYYLHQVVQAMHYVHKQHIMHRDLKLSNLFLSEKLEIKIGDFGLATKLTEKNQKRYSMCGTPNYIAPQIIDNKNGHSYQVDSWSIGVIAYTLLVGRPPFETNDLKTTYQRIKCSSYSFPQSVQISQRAVSFVGKLLQVDPSRRMTLQQCLKDQFFLLSSFPASLPISTLACPPNSNFLRQFSKEAPLQSGSKKRVYQSQDNINISKNSKLNRFNPMKSVSNKKQLSNGRQIGKFFEQRVFSSVGLNLNNKFFQQRCTGVQKCNFIWVTHFQNNIKFGIAYLLNSGIIGMKFNDNSLILAQNSKKLIYKTLDKNGEQQQSIKFLTEQLPHNLQKKATLLAYYNRQLRNQSNIEQIALGKEFQLLKDFLYSQKKISDNLFLVRYLETKKAIIFWFNNKSIQATFKDRSVILLQKSFGVFISKSFEVKKFNLTDSNKQSQQIQKRVKYLCQINEKIKKKSIKNQHEQNIVSMENQEPNQKQGFQIIRQNIDIQIQDLQN